MVCVFTYSFRVGVQRPNDEAINADAALNEAEMLAARIHREIMHYAKTTKEGSIMTDYVYQNEIYTPVRMYELEPDYVWGYEVNGQIPIVVHDLKLFC